MDNRGICEMADNDFRKGLTRETERVNALIRDLGVDLVGIAELSQLKGMPTGIPLGAVSLLGQYRCAIVMGAQYGKLGKAASGTEVSLFLEGAALKVLAHLELEGYNGLIVHTEDEFDPKNRIGLVSLKVLAKAAGLGWQGRSLLVVSPTYGPVHRWIAVLTGKELAAGAAIANQCGECSVCVDRCPEGALTLIRFDDHPDRREDVLEMGKCRGDDGCEVCMIVCPWMAEGKARCHGLTHGSN
jgi:epoxyqueuosine reductase